MTQLLFHCLCTLLHGLLIALGVSPSSVLIFVILAVVILRFGVGPEEDIAAEAFIGTLTRVCPQDVARHGILHREFGFTIETLELYSLSKGHVISQVLRKEILNSPIHYSNFHL